MAPIKFAFKKKGACLISSAALFMTSLSVQAGLFSTEWEVQLRRADEPAMRNTVPMQTLNDIRDIMIKESIEKHGYCACPYSTDALGGQCGSLSAYYYPWKKILCYRRDISEDHVEFFRIERDAYFYHVQEEGQEAPACSNQNDNAKKEKKDPTVDYFRNSALPLPRTISIPNITVTPNNGSNNNYQSDVQSNITLPNVTTTGGYNNLTVPSNYSSPLR